MRSEDFEIQAVGMMAGDAWSFAMDLDEVSSCENRSLV